MNRLALGLFAISIATTTISARALAACVPPATPAVPASFASREEAVATRLAVTDFLAGVDAYKLCISTERGSRGVGVTPLQASGFNNLVSVMNSKMTLVVETFDTAMAALP